MGRIWVDATDLQIVVTNGRMVPDDTRKGSEDLHPPFMTWRQQVDGHYWFPVYTKGEGILHFRRRQRLHGPGHAHPRHHQVHRLQAVRLDDQGSSMRGRILRRPQASRRRNRE